jgi:hypothetical protein
VVTQSIQGHITLLPPLLPPPLRENSQITGHPRPSRLAGMNGPTWASSVVGGKTSGGSTSYVFALVPAVDLKVAQDDELGSAGIVLKRGLLGAGLPCMHPFANGTWRRDRSPAELVAPFRWRSQCPITGGCSGSSRSSGVIGIRLVFPRGPRPSQRLHGVADSRRLVGGEPRLSVPRRRRVAQDPGAAS